MEVSMNFKKLTTILLVASMARAALAQDALAVLPFTGGDGEEGETVAELFSFTSEISAEFTLIPRTSISQAIGNEQKFQTGAGMTDPDSIAAIGRQLGAKYVVAGKIASLESRNLLIISILKIDDLRQIAGDIQTYAMIEEIQGKLPDMARNIIEAMRLDASRSQELDKLAVTPVAMGDRNVDANVADTLSQILSINIIRSGKYAVYPRTATLEQVRAEYDTQLSGVTADDELVDIGKGENPRFVLSVAARRLGALNMFNASIINLESGAQVKGGSESYNSLSDGRTAMTKLAQTLTGASVSNEEWTVTFDLSGGRVKGKTAAIKQTIPNGASLGTPPEPTRNGYVFDGWWTERDGRGTRFADSAPVTADTTLYAKWTAGAGPKRANTLGYGALNLALGLGSFIQGDLGGGLTTLLSYGAAAGLIYWEMTMDYDDDLAGIPGTVGLGVAGFAVVYGFIRPAVFANNRALAEIIDRIEIGVGPRPDGREAIRLTWTAKF
jgi:uncharacterized repeat protein (TIGR02543 family)